MRRSHNRTCTGAALRALMALALGACGARGGGAEVDGPSQGDASEESHRLKRAAQEDGSRAVEAAAQRDSSRRLKPGARGAAQAGESGSHGVTLVGITAGDQRANLAPAFPARIAKMAVREGATVAKGDIVVALDDSVQAARTVIARAAAESTLEVALARAEWDWAKRDLEHLLRLSGVDSASSKELSDARARAKIEGIEYELALFNHEQNRRALAREEAVLAEYRIRAPFAGYVAQHLKKPGDAVDALEEVVTLVQLDPLLVSVDCPLELAPLISEGDEVLVRPVERFFPARRGRVKLASKVADGASQTFRVKIEVGNKDLKWPAGLKVEALFTVSDPDRPPGILVNMPEGERVPK